MKKVTSIGLLFGVVALMLSVMTSVPADAASNGFSIETIAGTWITHIQGTAALALPGVGGEPVATIGRLTLNEDGTCEREFNTVTSLGSLPPSAPLISCTVIVNPDGTGSVTFVSLSPFSPTVINFRIVTQDKLVGLTTAGVMADPVVGVFHFARSTDPASSGFSIETIAGTWIGHLQATIALAVPGVGGVPVASTIRVTFNEDGTCEREGGTVTSFGSVPAAPFISCTVIVNPDGTGSITIVTLNNPFSPFVINFRIVDEDKLVGLPTIRPMADPVVGVFHFERERQDDQDQDNAD